MKIVLTETTQKQIEKLPQQLRKKLQKQFHFLQQDFRHPSLRARKKSGENVFEARIDQHNRFSYEIVDEVILVLSAGPHDVGLGKKIEFYF